MVIGDMETTYFLIPLFFLTALIYSSVGFAGGSTYLALLVLFGFPYDKMPLVALTCNLVVSAGGVYHAAKKGHLNLKRLLPFMVTSVPLAYFGGTMPIGEKWFHLLLGIALAIAGLRLLLFHQDIFRVTIHNNSLSWAIGSISGGFFGFVSGLVGIGGGIFLAPLLYFLRWGHARQIAAAASFFILVNSFSGFLGQVHHLASIEIFFAFADLWPLVLAVFVGGQMGSRLSMGMLSLETMHRVTAVLILLVAVKIFWNIV